MKKTIKMTKRAMKPIPMLGVALLLTAIGCSPETDGGATSFKQKDEGNEFSKVDNINGSTACSSLQESAGCSRQWPYPEDRPLTAEVEDRLRIAADINREYKEGPRLRFDVFLDGQADNYFHCWQDSLIKPMIDVCNNIWKNSHGLGNNLDVKRYCRCDNIYDFSPQHPNLEACKCTFPDEKSAELDLLSYAQEALNYINPITQKAQSPFNISLLELLLIYHMEGGYFSVAVNQHTNIDGFGFLGLDSLLRADGTLNPGWRPYAHPDLLSFLADENTQAHTFTNELGQSVYSIKNFTLRSSIYAFAAAYSYYKSKAAERFKKLHTFSREKQVFWAYTYFNCGVGCGNQKSSQSFENRNSYSGGFGSNRMNPNYNAIVRAATFAYQRRRCASGQAIHPALCE